MSFKRAVTVLVRKENLDNSQGQRNECTNRNFSKEGDNFQAWHAQAVEKR